MLSPELLANPRMRAALAQRDTVAVYRLLTKHGISQREILKGRQVQAYDVLLRIATGLGIERELMGLGLATYPDSTAAAEPGEEIKDCSAGSFSTCSRWRA